MNTGEDKIIIISFIYINMEKSHWTRCSCCFYNRVPAAPLCHAPEFHFHQILFWLSCLSQIRLPVTSYIHIYASIVYNMLVLIAGIVFHEALL